MKIYHNARCSKSRGCHTLLEEKNLEFETIEYLKTPLSRAELKDLLKKLNIKAVELIRKNEDLFKEKFAGKKLSEAKWLDAMVKYPKLMERPIVVKGDKAVIGRPIEKVIELLEN